ncbi:MAG TPA: hypothetical protein VK277_03330 [Acidimicrobiales bacterium]|nr:hypothetical protein [Acidimicrobiales bacterium]
MPDWEGDWPDDLWTETADKSPAPPEQAGRTGPFSDRRHALLFVGGIVAFWAGFALLFWTLPFSNSSLRNARTPAYAWPMFALVLLGAIGYGFGLDDLEVVRRGRRPFWLFGVSFETLLTAARPTTLLEGARQAELPGLPVVLVAYGVLAVGLVGFFLRLP